MANAFDRRVSKGSVQQNQAVMAYLRSMPDWWRDVLSARYSVQGGHRGLFLAVRNGYLNAYADGQSVLRIEFRTEGAQTSPRCDIHHKYIGEPKGKRDTYVFDGVRVAGQKYMGAKTLDGWIECARRYSDPEKIGVAAIAANHPNVIDLEMGLPANEATEQGGKKTAPRMDIVALERSGSKIQIVFYEAKRFVNPELKSKTGKPKVLNQLKKYEAYVTDPVRRAQVIAAYRNACSILLEIAQLRNLEVCNLTKAVATDPNLDLDLDPKPRLVIFDYDAPQAASKDWLLHKAVLERDHQVLMAKRAEDIVLGSHLA